MAAYCIIETDDGWEAVEHPEGITAEETAHRRGGILIDPGPYSSYEEAVEAMVALQDELEGSGAEDVPGTQALEGRIETGD